MNSMIQTRIVRAVVVLVLCWSSAWAEDLPAGAEAPVTAAAPATAPAEGRVTARSNISEAAIEMSDSERTALGAVRDRNTQLAETGFFMLLARAAKMETLSDRRLQDVESPSYPNLMAHPARYRAQPVRMTINVFTSEKLQPTPGGAFPVSSYWPKDKPVWYLTGLNAPLKIDPKQPVMVYSTADPTPVLGTPVKSNADAHVYALPGRRVNVVGLFYKLRTAPSEDEGERDYPVLLVWQVSGSGGGGALGSGGTTTIAGLMVAVLVLVLLLGFIMLRRRVSQQKASRPDGPRYKPLRDVARDEHEPEVEEAGEVDPLLKQAAEQYQKERQDDGQHGSS